MSKHYHRILKTGPAGYRSLVFIACILLSACSEQPVQGRQITGASPIRHAQQFETFIVSASAQNCIIRTKLPEQRVPGSWLDDRNSALRAALEKASVCCAAPKLALVEDWMIGFSAYEASFRCD